MEPLFWVEVFQGEDASLLPQVCVWISTSYLTAATQIHSLGEVLPPGGLVGPCWGGSHAEKLVRAGHGFSGEGQREAGELWGKEVTGLKTRGGHAHRGRGLCVPP